jgi:hypothetical protein
MRKEDTAPSAGDFSLLDSIGLTSAVQEQGR